MIIFSAISETELLAGQICNELAEKERVFHVLSRFKKLPAGNPIVRIAGDFRRKYGLMIPDSIIAASAIATDSTLITRNIKDFEKIPKLKIQKPY
ncbi:PIN domain-containing protein [Candidatus Woesearchaeota archaeon]|nr:PIN domain-containing protein [Candidatus Woesearchaeota archaeon]